MCEILQSAGAHPPNSSHRESFSSSRPRGPGEQPSGCWTARSGHSSLVALTEVLGELPSQTDEKAGPAAP